MEIKRILELRARMEKALAAYLGGRGDNPFNNRDIGYINPSADVYIDGRRQLIFIETPAMIEDSVKVDIIDDNLVFSSGKTVSRHTGRKYLQIERKIGSYTKRIPLAFKESEVVSVKHSYKLGVIKIEIEYGEKK